ncbi:hypothetical protein [Butyrivibrio sp. INlla16]|uniref:hypothetical protein n=1 Tax=Butyrivibrio sp. INlla16 TaxID=1520807 RepID=UPI000880F4C7|nr:hypothetical protein [Butyrivibrio sp. INlla16]SDB45217.1 hypothetical protein SAMN02910263_02203 [Butyrivibrio sp. INlla16]
MKKILTYAAFCILFIMTMIGLDRLLSEKSIHGIDQARSFYAQPKDSIDVLMLGSSHIHCDVNTALLWEKYGMAAYDYSAAEQTMWQTYYYFKEALKTQKPKVAVMDFYSVSRYKDDYQYDFLYENLQGLKPSINKLALFVSSCAVGRMDDYYPDFFTYHGRYEDLTKEDYDCLFGKENLASFKGYTPYCAVKPQVRPVLEEIEAPGLTDKQKKYLEKIIGLAKKNNITMLFIVAPYIIDEKDLQTYEDIAEIAEQNGIEFLDMNYSYDEIGLDFDKDFNDYSHLNYEGSCKFTEYFAGELLGRHGDKIEDHRGDKRYESWDESIKVTEEMRLEAIEKNREKKE